MRSRKDYDTRAIVAARAAPAHRSSTRRCSLAIAGATAVSLVLRNPLKVDVLRDRGALAREAAPGVIENVYRLQIMNTDEAARRFTIRADGFPGLDGRGREQPVDLGPAHSRVLPVRLRAPSPTTRPPLSDTAGAASDRVHRRSRRRRQGGAP